MMRLRAWICELSRQLVVFLLQKPFVRHYHKQLKLFIYTTKNSLVVAMY